MAPTAHRIHAPVLRTTLRSTAEAFLDTIGSSNTRRAYSIAILKTVDRLDGRAPDGLLAPSRALASVTDDEIGASLEFLWGTAAVNTWTAAPVCRSATSPSRPNHP